MLNLAVILRESAAARTEAPALLHDDNDRRLQPGRTHIGEELA